MANYQTHVSFAAGTGVVVATASFFLIPKLSWDALMIAVFFSFIGGMLPDLDHDTGIALRKVTALLSTFLPVIVFAVLFPNRGNVASISLLLLLPSHYLSHWSLRQFSWWKKSTPFSDFTSSVLVASICTFLILLIFTPKQWGFFKSWGIMLAIIIAIQLSVPIFKRLTVHRGIFHSIPTTVIYASLVYLIFYQDQHFPLRARLLISLSAFAGILSHLILDEIYSIDLTGKKPRIKRSFGTAFSFWKKDTPIISTMAYLLAGGLFFLCLTTSGFLSF